MHVWMLENNFVVAFLFFYLYMGSGNQTQFALIANQVPLPVEPFRQPRTKDLVASYMLIRHVHRMFHSLYTVCTGLFYPHF